MGIQAATYNGARTVIKGVKISDGIFNFAPSSKKPKPNH